MDDPLPQKPGFRRRIACPVCGGRDIERIYSGLYDRDPVKSLVASNFASQGIVDWSLLIGVALDIDKCLTCDLIYQVEEPDEAMLNVIYTQMITPRFIDEYESKLLTLDNFNRIAGELAVIFQRIGKDPGEIAMLDFGSGQGRWARVARGMGATVFVTELGEDKKRLASSLGLEPIDDAAVDTMQFDLVHTEQVLEHLTHPGRDFARLARATRPGGLFKAAVPYRGDLERLLKSKGLPTTAMFASGGAKQIPGEAEAFVSIQPLEHLNAFSDRTIEWLAAKNGLTHVSRVRRRSVALSFHSLSSAALGAKQIAAEIGKAALRPKIGYHLLRKDR